MSKLLGLLVCFVMIWRINCQKPCNLYCDENDRSIPRSVGGGSRGDVGSPGKKGPRGFRGEKGGIGQKGTKGEVGEVESSELDRLHASFKGLENIVESTRKQNLPTSCKQISDSGNATGNGIYYIRDSNNIEYPVYCDMSINGGGWTLVASVHENNIRTSGRCRIGDKWSSEHGNEPGSQVGAEAWFNYEMFGSVTSATSEDYKNAAYFDLNARDVMIWQVPNDTPLTSFSSASYLQYYTSNGFLSRYGGNMFSLYKNHLPIKSGVYRKVTDNGPAIPVSFAKGNAEEILRHFGANVRPQVEPGYIQFRAVNNERSAYALCPGTRGKSTHVNLEHSCIGSTADNVDVKYCGDFSAFRWNTASPGTVWNVDLTLLRTTFMIFYR